MDFGLNWSDAIGEVGVNAIDKAAGARLRVCLLGASGTIGRATLAELVRRGHEVVCLVRHEVAPIGGAVQRRVNFSDPHDIAAAGFAGERFDAVISCMASRSGVPADAWAVDHAAHLAVLAAAQSHGIERFVLLSAICVQRPRLAFQQAKLAFEQALAASGITYSIVRPTAFFKSLSGQIARVQAGKPFLVFGDGTLTRCKPISDRDLATYLVDCLDQRDRWNRVMPIGGPGPAITPIDQGRALFAMLGKPARFSHVPLALMDAIIAMLRVGGVIVPALRAKAELARIGRYYAGESMLVFDPVAGRYDADQTPEFGSDTLFDYYRAVLDGREAVERGDHAVF